MKTPCEKRYTVILVLGLLISIAGLTPAFALTADPMDLSVGARAMGMGKAYVAVAEDSETVFINPAGLGTINTLKLGSMYTNLMDDIGYTVISAAYPLDNDSGTLGVGVINESASKIYLFNQYGTDEGYGTYGSNTYFVSQGVDLSRKYFPGMPGVFGGYTLKYIMKSATGNGTQGMEGSGLSSDLGLLYKPKGFISYGLTLQDILAGSMSYKDEQDNIDSSAIVGTKMSILGDTTDGGALLQNDSKLDMALDLNMGISQKIPGTTHLGLEYKPTMGVNYIDNILALRAGVNQVSTPTGNVNNMTLGVGITYLGIQFNYAYSPAMADLPDTSQSFFSLSWVGVPKQEKKIEEMKPLIGQVMPDDKIITKDGAILIQGSVNEPSKIAKVEINGAGVNVSSVTGTFEMNVPLSNVGKHLITVKASDTTGRTEEHLVRVIRVVKFADVPDNHWAVTPVERLATVGLIEGYPNGTFQPERALSRAELSTLLVKSKGIEPPVVTGKVFKDLPASHWAARYVKGALDLGLVTGYPDKTFKPNNKITRTEGVVVLTRFGELMKDKVALIESPYPDITARFWASPYIAAAKTGGLLDYIGDNDFEPKRELTRAEAVEILSKTSYGRAKVDALMDWTVGFEPSLARPAIAAVPGVIGAPVPSAKPVKGGPVATNLKDFTDVADEFWAGNSIKYLATAGIMSGYPDGTFKPERIVTRAELSAILVKAKDIQVGKSAVTGFVDVPAKSWASPYVKASVDSGYMTARKAGKFEPNRGASRAESVAAVVKFDNMALPEALKAGPFPDMTAREWSSRYVAAAKDAGMLGYLTGQDFEADKSITRAELADIIAKTKFGQAKIDQVKASITDIGQN